MADEPNKYLDCKPYPWHEPNVNKWIECSLKSAHTIRIIMAVIIVIVILVISAEGGLIGVGIGLMIAGGIVGAMFYLGPDWTIDSASKLHASGRRLLEDIKRQYSMDDAAAIKYLDKHPWDKQMGHQQQSSSGENALVGSFMGSLVGSSLRRK